MPVTGTAAAPSIPPPPPLPPNKTSYFSRFVTQPLTTAYGSRPPSSQTHRPDGGRPSPLVPRLPGARTASSQDASHIETGLDISAIDINHERTHAVLAGKDILKTVRVNGAKIVDETDLRAAVINYPDRTTPARQREGLGVHDVKWSHGQFSTHIATAAANGKVVLYDLNRAGIELARLHEHTRQVHKLAFNPFQGYLLLSASQDATVRLWDLRAMRKDVMTCPSRDQYLGMNNGIRDVQWSPTDAVEFAFGTDNGIIQRWDYRQTRAPKQKITAHDQRICTSIDWHPDGKHLLSASVDKTVKIWDFSVDGRRQKPTFVLNTPHPVHHARWRPPYRSDEYYEKGAYQCTQFATSYDRDHPVIHVWDVRRPFLPFREINKFKTAPNDMLWHSRDTLWTVGKEGVFRQNDVHLAPKVIDRRNLQAFAVSPSGEIAGVAQQRPRHQRSGLDYSSDDTYLGKKRSSPGKSSLRNSADDSLDDSFLTSSSSLKKHHGRRSSNRSAKSFGSTPPSETAPNVMLLTDSMAMQNESFKPNQIALRGMLPGAINVQIFAYLAQKYKTIPLPDPPTLQSFVDLQHVFEQNAEYAQRAAFHRLAETWRIVGVSVAVATRRRAELHRKLRNMQHSPRAATSDAQPRISSQHQPTVPQQPAVRTALDSAPGTSQSPHGMNQAAYVTPSTSNLPTPLARPVITSSSSTDSTQSPSKLPNPDHDDELRLPPAAAGPHSTKENSLFPESAVASKRSNLSNGPQWYHSPSDLDERRAMIGSWRAPPREPLSLEPTNARGLGIAIPPRLDRHDSEESFTMFSASTDSPRGTSVPSSFASGRSQPQSMQSIPETWQHAPPGSSFGKPRFPELGAALDKHALGDNNLAISGRISSTAIPIGEVGSGAGMPSEGVQQGSARNSTGHPVVYSSREQAVLDIANLRRNNQLLRHDSSESEALSSSRGGLSLLSSLDYNNEMEASGTIVPEFYEDARSPRGQKPPQTTQHAAERTPPVLEPVAVDPLLLSDYQDMHVDAEQGSAIAVIGLLRSILAFYTSAQSDAQMCSILILLITPLLPQTQSSTDLSGIDKAEVLSNFSETITALGLTPTQTETILSTQLNQLLTTGINPFQAEAILHTYHAQLHSLSLFNAAASLRRLAYPTYPAVYEQALKDTQLGLLCLSCKSPINNPKDKMRCETCKRAQAPCAICWGRYPAFEPVTAKKKTKAKLRSSLKDKGPLRRKHSLSLNSPNTMDTCGGDEDLSPSLPEKATADNATLWTWCPLCGHGGHTNCLSTWYTDALSEGACATEGCLCDCVQGQRREDKVKETLAMKAEKERNKLVRKGDDWKVKESKAVSAVRTSFGDAAGTAAQNSQNRTPAGNPGGARASGLLPSRRDDARRVRVVGPQDRR